jgi:hypothetical protein
MLLKIFAIYDSKSEIYNKPFFAPTAGAAIRDFELAINNEDSMLAKYPDDYTLFEVGVYEDTTCEIRAYDAKISLGSANEYKKQEQLKAVGD